MLDILSIFIHFYCLCLFIRVLFPEREELFFHPFFRVIRDITDPVLLFLKNNRIINTNIHPLIPMFLLLVLKSILYQSSLAGPVSINLNSFLITLFQFLSFLFKVYLVLFWIIFSSNRYNFYDDIFNLLSTVFNKTLLLFPFSKRNLSVRNDPFQAISLIALIFLLFSIIINLALVFSNTTIPNNISSVIGIFFSSLKIVLMDLTDMLNYLPFLLFVRIIISWFIPPMTRVLLLLHTITEPVLEPFRKLNLNIGMIDFSPIVAFFVLQLIISFLQQLVRSLP